MSFLSVNNMIAPVTNKTNLVTIILVATLFGLYRYAGGQIEFRPEINMNDAPTTISSEILDESEGGGGNEETSDLDEMLGSAKSGSSHRRAAGSDSDLDDIEKSLGLK
jgi:hypothetical protein